MKRLLILTAAMLLTVVASAAPMIQSFGVTYNAGASVYPGNVLFADCNSPNPDGTAEVYLINQTGAVLKSWKSEALLFLAKPAGTDGSIVTWRRRITTTGTSGCGDTVGSQALYKISSALVASKIYVAPNFAQSHDFEVLSDGTYLILGNTLITDTAVTAQPFLDDVIVHVDANGNVLWSWSTDKHYAQLGLSAQAKSIIAAGQTLYKPDTDIFHTNSIQSIPPNASASSNPAFSAGNILVSQRNTNIIFVIDKTTGNIVWEANNISVGQHSPKIIPTGLPGDGHILMYNNGGWAGYPGVSQQYDSVLEYDPIAGTVTWQYSSAVPKNIGLNSFWRGNAQRLPNGNTFIDEAQWGRFFEVDKNGTIVWEYVYQFPNKNAPIRTIYRAYKVEPCWAMTSPGCAAESTLPDGSWTW